MEGKARGILDGGRDELELCFGSFVSAADAVPASTFSFGPGTDVEVSLGLFITGDVGAVTASLILPLGFALPPSNILVVFANAPSLSVLARTSTSELADAPGVECIRLWPEPAVTRTWPMYSMVEVDDVGEFLEEPALISSMSS